MPFHRALFTLLSLLFISVTSFTTPSLQLHRGVTTLTKARSRPVATTTAWSPSNEKQNALLLSISHSNNNSNTSSQKQQYHVLTRAVQLFHSTLRKLRHKVYTQSLVTILTVSILLGQHPHSTTMTSPFRPPPSHAASTATRVTNNANDDIMDQLMTQYAKRYAFSSSYDSYANAYSEAHADGQPGAINPISLTVSSALSEVSGGRANPTAKIPNPFSLLGRALSGVIEGIVAVGVKLLGWDESSARVVAAVGTVMALPVVLGYGILGLGGGLRKFLIGQENRRYGGVSDLTAIEKEEEIVEADEDDDDYDDDDDNDSSGKK